MLATIEPALLSQMSAYARIFLRYLPSFIMTPSFTRILTASLIVGAFATSSLPAFAATVQKAPAPVRITYIKGYIPTMVGDYPNASFQVTINNKIYTINAPDVGTAVSNISVPVNPKNKDVVYLSTMDVAGKNIPTSLVYEFNLKTNKSKLLFSEKNAKRKLRIAGIDGTNIILVEANTAIEGRCASLWTGRYKFFTFDGQKPAKTLKAYAVSSGLKKLGESEEQACKSSFGFKK
jgi:hypothetical protein